MSAMTSKRAKMLCSAATPRPTCRAIGTVRTHHPTASNPNPEPKNLPCGVTPFEIQVPEKKVLLKALFCPILEPYPAVRMPHCVSLCLVSTFLPSIHSFWIKFSFLAIILLKILAETEYSLPLTTYVPNCLVYSKALTINLPCLEARTASYFIKSSFTILIPDRNIRNQRAIHISKTDYPRLAQVESTCHCRQGCRH